MILPLTVTALLLTQQPLPPTEPPTKPRIFKTVKSNYQLELEAIERKEREERLWLSGSMTAYYNGKDVMNGETGVTASEYDLDNGIYYNGYRILASDERYPLGTLVDIRLKNGTVLHGVVLDRGGRIKGNKFDIVMNSYDECMTFGHRQIKFKIKGRIDV